MRTPLINSPRFGLASKPIRSFFVCVTLLVSSVAEAQPSKPFLVRFANHTGERLRLEVTHPQYENLGILNVNEVTEIDFHRGEKVKVTYVRTGAQRGVLVVDGNQTLEIYNPRKTENPQGTVGGTGGRVGDGTDSATGLPATIGGGRISAMGGQAGSLQTEIQSALKIVNEKRRQHGVAPLKFNARLQQAALRRAKDMASRTHTANDINHSIAHEFPDPLTGKQIGANKWAREAGYRLPALDGDQNTIESTHGSGGSAVILKGIGKEVIGAFFSEGPSGGHYRAMVSPRDKDFAFASVINANRTAIVTCVLTAHEEAGRPSDPGTGNVGTGNTGFGNNGVTGQSSTMGQGRNSGQNGSAGNEQTAGSIVSFRVTNQSQTDAAVYETDRNTNASRLVGVATAGRSQSFDVSPQSIVKVSTPGGLESVLATTSQVTIPKQTATLTIKYSKQTISLYLFYPKLEQSNGIVKFGEVAQPVSKHRGGRTIQEEVPVGTRVVVETDPAGKAQRKILADTTIDLTESVTAGSGGSVNTVGAFDVTGKWAKFKGPQVGSPDAAKEKVEFRHTPIGILISSHNKDSINFLRSPENPNRYVHENVPLFLQFSDANTARVEGANETFIRIKNTVDVQITNEKPDAIQITRLDDNTHVKFEGAGAAPDGLLLPGQSLKTTLPRGVKIRAAGLVGPIRYLDNYAVNRDGENVKVNGFSVQLTNNTGINLGVLDDVTEDVIAPLNANSSVSLAIRPGKTIRVLDVNGKLLLKKTLQSDLFETFEP